MNKIILIFISSVSIVVPGFSIADTIAPPNGPYRSIEENTSSFNHADRDYHTNNMDSPTYIQKNSNPQRESTAVPEWVKRRQAGMSNWLEQQENQAAMQRREQYSYRSAPMQNQQARQQWEQRQAMPMNAPHQQINPQGENPQFSQPQTNRMKQYFPAARGPVYGPNVPPPAGYNNPNYQNKPPGNVYPPAWR